jgi:phage virion morphogenesis protein
MQEIRIQIKDQAVDAALKGLADRMKDLSPVMRIIGEYLLRSTEERFDREGPGPDGTPWPPLAASTRRRKKHPKILTESGNLRGRIRYQVTGPGTLVVGSAEPYAAIHQLGGTIRKAAGSITVRHRTDARGNLMTTALFGGKGLIFAKASHKRALARTFASREHEIAIPARPFLGVSQADSEAIVGIVNRYLMAR